jgi:hypothetical protein
VGAAAYSHWQQPASLTELETWTAVETAAVIAFAEATAEAVFVQQESAGQAVEGLLHLEMGCLHALL